MDSSVIYKQLRFCFSNHVYQINNQYIFRYDWESDFFAMSSSGYGVEVEVKVSVSDFKKDFLKEKHKIFKALAAGRNHWVQDLGKDRHYKGDFICKYRVGKLRVEYSGREYDWMRRSRYMHWFYNTNIHHEVIELRAPCHNIRIHKLDEIKIPNKFYFAVPEGLKVSVPDYAGLITVSEHGYTIVKPAPFLHKRKVDYWKVLLDKFYYKFRGFNV